MAGDVCLLSPRPDTSFPPRTAHSSRRPLIPYMDSSWQNPAIAVTRPVQNEVNKEKDFEEALLGLVPLTRTLEVDKWS